MKKTIQPPPHLPTYRLRELAVRASVCPPTIAALLAGRPVRGMAGQRAVAVLIAEGLLPVGTGAA